MKPFRNNLEKDDAVFDTVSKRPGAVMARPFRSRRATLVRLQGSKDEDHLDVMQLRLLVNGKTEEVAPIDGEPPSLDQPAKTPKAASGDPVALLKAEKASNKVKMDSMTAEFKVLRLREERIDKAIAALEGAA